MKRQTCLVAAAAALLLSGCGRKAPDQAPAQAAAPRRVARAQVFSTRVYEPAVHESARLVAVLRASKAPVFRPLANLYGRLPEFMRAWCGDRIQRIKTAKTLSFPRVEWCVVSAGGDLSFDPAAASLPRISLAARFDHDIEMFADALAEAFAGEDGGTLVPCEVAGQRAWRIDDAEFRAMGLAPCLSSMEGRVLVVASGEDVLAGQIALYRDGTGASGKFVDVLEAKDAVFGLSAPDVGGAVRELFKDSMDLLSMVDMFMPNGTEAVLGLKSFDLSLASTPPAGDAARIEARLEAGDEEAADSIRTLLKALTLPWAASLKDAPDAESKLIYAVVRGLKIGGDGGVVTLRLPLLEEVVALAAEGVFN